MKRKPSLQCMYLLCNRARISEWMVELLDAHHSALALNVLKVFI